MSDMPKTAHTGGRAGGRGARRALRSAPDFDITSLGDEKFAWTVEKMADLVIRLAGEPLPKAQNVAELFARVRP